MRTVPKPISTLSFLFSTLPRRRHECFQQPPVMRFSMRIKPEEMMLRPLKSPSATNKGTIFCRNGIFQLSGRCSLCSRPPDFDLAASHGFKKVLYCSPSSKLPFTSDLSGGPDMGSVRVRAHSNSEVRSHLSSKPRVGGNL